MRGKIVALTLLVAFGCGEKTAEGPGAVDPNRIASIAVRPASVLLARADSTAELRVVAFGEDGAELPGTVAATFEVVSGPLKLENTTVSANRVGFGRVAVTVGDQRADVWVTSARAKSDVVLVNDDQVTEAAHDFADGEIGQYEVGIDGGAEQGDLLLGTGAEIVYGRVLSASGDAVRLEVIPMNEVFDELEIAATFEPEDLALEVADGYRAVKDGDSYRVEVDDTPGQRQQALGLPQGTKAIGPFGCSESGISIPLEFSGAPTLTVTPDVSVDVAGSIEGGFEHFVVTGSVDAKFDFKPRITAAVEGKIDCTVEVGQFVLPIGGPMSLLFGGFLPFGVGVEVTAKIDAELGADLSVSASATVSAGVVCEEECELVGDADLTIDESFAWALPGTGDLFDLELGAFGFAFLDTRIGTPLVNALQFKLSNSRVGLTASGDFATRDNQLADPAYASEHKGALTFVFAAGLQADFFAGLVSITLAKLEHKEETELTHSPRGTLQLDQEMVAVPDTVTGTVALADATLFGLWDVETVRIYRRQDAGVPYVLVASVPGVPEGQTDVPWTWTPALTDTGQQDLLATVETATLPGFEFEVASNSLTSVDIGVAGVSVTAEFPPQVQMGVGGNLLVTVLEDDAPVEGATVEVTGTNALPALASGTTNTDGEFEMNFQPDVGATSLSLEVVTTKDGEVISTNTVNSVVLPPTFGILQHGVGANARMDLLAFDMSIAPSNNDVNFDLTFSDRTAMASVSDAVTANGSTATGTASATANLVHQIDATTGNLQQISVDLIADATAGVAGSSGGAQAYGTASFGTQFTLSQPLDISHDISLSDPDCNYSVQIISRRPGVMPTVVVNELNRTTPAMFSGSTSPVADGVTEHHISVALGAAPSASFVVGGDTSQARSCTGTATFTFTTP